MKSMQSETKSRRPVRRSSKSKGGSFSEGGRKLAFAAITAILVMFSIPQMAVADYLPKNATEKKIIENAWEFLVIEKPLLAYADTPFLEFNKNKYLSGLNMEDMILDLLYPTSGRTKYVQYVPKFGKNKMYYRKLEWENYKTDHISLFTYDEKMKDLFISLTEETYADLAKTFETESFDWKLWVYIYRDRRDFSQMNFAGINPSGILGVTHDLRKWHNKLAFLFEGSKSELFEVGQHEMVHRFNMEQIYHETGQDMLGNPPLWFVEGLAVSYSIGWSAIHEWVARDGYYNEFLEYGILPQGRGTFLPYVTGTMMVNYIKKNYGTDTINAIIKDSAEFAKKKQTDDNAFDEILEKYTDHSAKELYNKMIEEFEKGLEKSDDDIDIKSPVVAKGRVLAAHKNFLLRLEGKYLRYNLYLSQIENGKIVTEKKIAVDGKIKTESLRMQAALSDTHLAYVTFQSSKGTDVLRVAPYKLKGEKIKIGKYREYSLPEIIFITSPVFVDENQVAFVGLEDGFTNIYLLDIETPKESKHPTGQAKKQKNKETKELKQLTNGTSHIAGIDYSAERNELVFSRESDERTDNPNKCDFNYDLHLLNLETLEETKLVETIHDELSPQWVNENRVIFETDEAKTFGLSMYDIEAQRFVSVGTTRITAVRPKILDENTVIFHSTKYLGTKPRLLELPSAPPINVIPVKTGIQNKNGSPAFAEDDSNGHAEKIIGNTVIKNGKLFVTNGKKSYPVKRFVAMRNDLFFDVEIEPGKISIIKFNEKINRDPSGKSVKDKSVVEFRENHSIMWEGLSPDNKFLIFAANNRLRWEDKKKAKEYPVSVHIYNTKDKKFTTKFDFKMKSTKGFHSALFLNNNYLLLNIGDKVVLINPGANKEFYLRKVEFAKVSPNKRFVVWTEKKKKKPQISIFDTQTEKLAELGEFKSGDNLKFTINNELVWSRTSTKLLKDTTFHIYIWNYEKGLKEIKIDITKKATLPAKKKTILDFKVENENSIFLLVKDKKTEKKKIYRIQISETNEGVEASISPIEIGNLAITKLQLIRDGYLFFKAKSNKKIKLGVYDIERKKIRIKRKPKNADATDTYLVLESGNSITVYDSIMQTSKLLHETAGFNLKENELVFSHWNGKDYDIFEMNLDSNVTINLTQTPLKDETNPYRKNEEIKYSIKPVQKGKKVTYILAPPPPKYSEGKVVKDKISKLPFDVIDGMGLASAGYGYGKFYLMGYIDLKFHDIFEDGTLSLYYFGGIGTNYNFADVSYLHRPSGHGVRIFCTQYVDDIIPGIDYFHVFRLSKFQRIVVGAGYKYQILDNPYLGDYFGSGNVISVNASYTLDTTRHMLHGPQDGVRLYLGTNIGYNPDENDLNNLDINVAWRQYVNIKNLASFAYRIEAGTSLGIAPTWYGIGGNMTLRGLPFVSKWGNTYAIAGADFRLDLIYYAGAILKEPLTAGSTLLLAFMPQIGWFADVGTVFYYNPLAKSKYDYFDDEAMRHVFEDLKYSPELYWSTGPFINLPYLPLGMILRFNWSIAGTHKYWNFWFGFNW